MRYLRPNKVSETTLRKVLLGELEAKAIVTNKEELQQARKLHLPVDVTRSIKEGGVETMRFLLEELETPAQVVEGAVKALKESFYLLPAEIAKLIYEKTGSEQAIRLVLMHHTPAEIIEELVKSSPELLYLVRHNPRAPMSLINKLPCREKEEAIYRRVLYPEYTLQEVQYCFWKNASDLVQIALLGREEYDVTAYFATPPYPHMVNRILRILRGAKTVKVRAPWQFQVLQRLNKGMRTTKELRASEWTAINVQWCYFYGWIVKDGKKWKFTDTGREALEIVKKKKELMPPTIELPIAPTKEGVKCMLTRRW